MNKEVILITDYLNFIRQDVKVVSSIDISKFKTILEEEGFKVRQYTFDELANKSLNISNKSIIYSSSQQEEYKNYIDDILYSLSYENHLVPRYEIFRAHENKGYQELLKREKSIPSLGYYYLSNEKDIEFYKESINYPIIFKKVRGSTSIGVKKIHSYSELLKVIKKENKTNHTLKNKLKRIGKKLLNQETESKFLGRFVLQEYIPNLEDDWKVLIFNEKYYVLNRKVRGGDFRASGSGLVSYIEPPEGLLDFSKEIFNQLDVPFVSLDICFDGSKFYLIEYQGLHMGPITLVNSSYYFVEREGKWERVNEKSDLSTEYARSIVSYLKQ